MLRKAKHKIANIVRKYFFSGIERQYCKQINDLQEQLEWLKQHSDITSLKPATGYARKKQRELLAFVEEFMEFTKELNLHPFLTGGNLIGAVRHGGFIPWDDDMDFGLIRSETEKLIAFCKEKCVVDIYEGSWSGYSREQTYSRMARMLALHPGKYILDIWVDQLQIYKGTSVVDVQFIDFWPFDYYDESYRIEDHMEYLDNLLEEIHQIDNVKNIVSFLQKERKNNPNISEHETGIIFPGIDNVGGFLSTKRLKSWLYADDILPLQKIKYENTSFYAPHKLDKYLEYLTPDYMSYPADVGLNKHDRYKVLLSIVPVVVLIVQKIQDIEYFLPLHEYFEEHGIYSLFLPVVDGEKDSAALSAMYERLEEKEVQYRKAMKVQSWSICMKEGNPAIKDIKAKYNIICNLNSSELEFFIDGQIYKGYEDLTKFIKGMHSANCSN